MSRVTQQVPAQPRRKMSPEMRHRVMASIRKTDTRPELVFRAALRRHGLVGYRTHARKITGNPDVVFTRWRVVVFVDGVFWHGHPDFFRRGTKGRYWDAKIGGNIARDKRVTAQLRQEGWTVLRFWDKDVLADADAAVEAVRKALARRGHSCAHVLP